MCFTKDDLYYIYTKASADMILVDWVYPVGINNLICWGVGIYEIFGRKLYFYWGAVPCRHGGL